MTIEGTVPAGPGNALAVSSWATQLLPANVETLAGSSCSVPFNDHGMVGHMDVSVGADCCATIKDHVARHIQGEIPCAVGAHASGVMSMNGGTCGGTACQEQNNKGM